MLVLNSMKSEGMLPCLIVLDINMPKMDGKQTLLALKSDQSLSKVPVIIFSTSSSQLDCSFFEMHKIAYFIKPLNFAEFTETTKTMINMCSKQK